jgi:hypothetical protein
MQRLYSCGSSSQSLCTKGGQYVPIKADGGGFLSLLVGLKLMMRIAFSRPRCTTVKPASMPETSGNE